MSTIEKVSAGVSFPVEILRRIDNFAAQNFIDRSAAITRIFLEWEELKKGGGVNVPSLDQRTAVEAVSNGG